MDCSAFTHVLEASNPAGVLTPELKPVIAQAVQLEEPTVVVVDGEEDLAPLYIHLVFRSMRLCSTANPALVWLLNRAV